MSRKTTRPQKRQTVDGEDDDEFGDDALPPPGTFEHFPGPDSEDGSRPGTAETESRGSTDGGGRRGSNGSQGSAGSASGGRGASRSPTKKESRVKTGKTLTLEGETG